MVDSQAAIKALVSPIIKSELVLKTIETLNEVGLNNSIIFHWVRAHVGTDGNERADELAKEGASTPKNDNGEFADVPFAHIKGIISEHIITRWNNYWINHPDLRQSKLFFPKIDLKKSSELYKTDKSTFSALVRWISGHCFLKRHNYLIRQNVITESDEATDPLCRLCEDELETPQHLVTECPCLINLRLNCFGVRLSDPLNPTWDVRGLITFLKDPLIQALEQDGDCYLLFWDDYNKLNETSLSLSSISNDLGDSGGTVPHLLQIASPTPGNPDREGVG